MGQLPREERTNALGLVGCQERWQTRDRLAGLPGTSRCSKRAALQAPDVPKHLASCSWADTAQLWGARSICTLLLIFLAPKLPLEVIVREGYFPSQPGTLVLTSYISSLFLFLDVFSYHFSMCPYWGRKNLFDFNRSPSRASYAVPAYFIQYGW